MRKHKNLPAILIVSSVLILIAYVVLIVILPSMLKPATQLWLGDGIFRTDLALDGEARTKGLSGVSKLDPDQALLMVFPTDDKWGIWMKDMKIPIDIVWLDSDKKVVYIVKNASPEISDSKTFKPQKDARYVVELPAGTVDSKAINTNGIAIFEINSSEVE